VSHDLFDEPPAPSGALIRPFLGSDMLGADEEQNEPDPALATLRPFLLTSGRVPAESDIAIETQVVCTHPGEPCSPVLAFERRGIVELCQQPLSVAEIAARLKLHLSVVRVLVGDLSAGGHLSVYVPNTDAPSDVDTLLRVIRGLRAIS
jgi:Protein of unknown function (DUF742)